MEENNILNKNNKKKILIGSIIMVLVLVVIVVGSTYAYFTMGTINNSEDTEITIKTGKNNNVKLTGGTSSYKLHLEVADMAQNKINSVYYGTTDANKNYETEEEKGTIILGDLELEGEIIDDYTCNATVNIALDGDMQSELQDNDLVLVIKQGETEAEYDLSESITNPNFEFDLNNIEPIKAYLKFTNQDADQSGLAGKTLNVTININDFKCEINKGKVPLEMLQETGGEVFAGGGDHTTLVDGLYRYYGTESQVTNNYICLGPTSKDTCQDGENMYRIIGITTDGKLKVIKASKYGENKGWFSSNRNGTWSSSELYTYLNGPSDGNFYDSLDTRIQGLIENHIWNMDQLQTYPWASTATGNKDGTIQNHIGLMYGTDYVNAYHNNTTNNWLFITNGWSGNTAENEWTMSRYGPGGYAIGFLAWNLSTYGSLVYGDVSDTFAVRPVFYLISDIRLSGEGTESNPFIISEV